MLTPYLSPLSFSHTISQWSTPLAPPIRSSSRQTLARPSPAEGRPRRPAESDKRAHGDWPSGHLWAGRPAPRGRYVTKRLTRTWCGLFVCALVGRARACVNVRASAHSRLLMDLNPFLLLLLYPSALPPPPIEAPPSSYLVC